jgi:hypothetical protein
VVRVGCRKPERYKGTIGRNRKFFLGFENGIMEFVDYNECFGKPVCITTADLKADVNDAFQQAVRNQFNRERKLYWDAFRKAKLDVSEKVIQGSSADYEPPMTFDTVISDFMKRYSFTYEQLIAKIEYHGSHKKKIGDDYLLNQWKAFHKEIPLIVKVMKVDMPYLQTLLEQHRLALKSKSETCSLQKDATS